MALLGVVAACSSAALGTGDTGGTGGTGTHAGMGGTSTTTATITSAVATGVAGVGGGAGGSVACAPPAAAGSLWALSAQQYGLLDPTSMCDYRGDVLLIVNTADV
jgi:hypothetical protein